jgi:hypothetical protein
MNIFHYSTEDMTFYRGAKAEPSSVAKGPQFRPQNTKGAEKNCVGPEKSGAEYLPDLTKKGRKGAELFLKFKTAKFLTEN